MTIDQAQVAVEQWRRYDNISSDPFGLWTTVAIPTANQIVKTQGHRENDKRVMALHKFSITSDMSA